MGLQEKNKATRANSQELLQHCCVLASLPVASFYIDISVIPCVVFHCKPPEPRVVSLVLDVWFCCVGWFFLALVPVYGVCVFFCVVCLFCLSQSNFGFVQFVEENTKCFPPTKLSSSKHVLELLGSSVLVKALLLGIT